MGYTNRKYLEMEIAILTRNYPDHVYERAKEGDIIVVRNIHYVIGLKERTEYLWLRIEGMEENRYSVLKFPNHDRSIDNEEDESIPNFDKRRYCIPLHRLKELYPAFNISRARNIVDEYQPFMILDEDTGKYLTPKKAIHISGLVFDKVRGEYI